MSKKLEFNRNMKLPLIVLMALGVIGLIWAYLWVPDNKDLISHGTFNYHARFWSNILLNTYYFAGIAITGVFFICAHHLGYSGWQTVFKKIPMAMAKFLYIALAIMIVITLGLVFDWHSLYGHWSMHTDAIVDGKKPFLTKWFYALVVIVFYTLWALFGKMMHTKFMNIANLKEYKSAKVISAVFLLVFGVSSSVLSWMVVMSIDPHWYSTLFGWYNLMSYFAAGMSMMALIIIYLKSKGLLESVNEDHIHDIAKYMFGFSVFWTYLWFSQFMLIWYANIPEATVWFQKRFNLPLFKFILLFNLVINFLAPLLIILKRSTKRNFKVVSFVAVLLIIGHYLDFYGMIMLEPMNIPHEVEGDEHANNNVESNILYAEHEVNDGHDHEAGEHHDREAHSDHAEDAIEHAHEEHHDDHAHTEDAHEDHGHDEANHHSDEAHDDHATHTAGAHDTHGGGHDSHGDGHGDHEHTNLATIGLPEIFIFLGFLGLFLYVVFSALHDIELEVTEDPFLKESLHHHFDY